MLLLQALCIFVIASAVSSNIININYEPFLTCFTSYDCLGGTICIERRCICPPNGRICPQPWPSKAAAAVAIGQQALPIQNIFNSYQPAGVPVGLNVMNSFQPINQPVVQNVASSFQPANQPVAPNFSASFQPANQAVAQNVAPSFQPINQPVASQNLPVGQNLAPSLQQSVLQSYQQPVVHNVAASYQPEMQQVLQNPFDRVWSHLRLKPIWQGEYSLLPPVDDKASDSAGVKSYFSYVAYPGTSCQQNSVCVGNSFCDLGTCICPLNNIIVDKTCSLISTDKMTNVSPAPPNQAATLPIINDVNDATHVEGQENTNSVVKDVRNTMTEEKHGTTEVTNSPVSINAVATSPNIDTRHISSATTNAEPVHSNTPSVVDSTTSPSTIPADFSTQSTVSGLLSTIAPISANSFVATSTSISIASHVHPSQGSSESPVHPEFSSASSATLATEVSNEPALTSMTTQPFSGFEKQRLSQAIFETNDQKLSPVNPTEATTVNQPQLQPSQPLFSQYSQQQQVAHQNSRPYTAQILFHNQPSRFDNVNQLQWPQSFIVPTFNNNFVQKPRSIDNNSSLKSH